MKSKEGSLVVSHNTFSCIAGSGSQVGAQSRSVGLVDESHFARNMAALSCYEPKSLATYGISCTRRGLFRLELRLETRYNHMAAMFPFMTYREVVYDI